MASIAKRLKERRKALGLSLQEAAKLAGFKNFQTLSKVENGNRELKADELVALARAYTFDINLFLEDKPQPSNVRVFWRADPNPPPDRSAEHRFKMFFERYLHLEGTLGRSVSEIDLPRYKFRKMTLIKAGEYGERYSHDLKLGDRPALSIASILEQDYNLPIFYLPLPDGASAVSIISDNRAAICVNSNDVPWRRSFDIAHELFHIIYEKSISEKCGTTSNSFYEKFANAFASSLLLPKDSLERAIKQYARKSSVNVPTLVVMARDLGVSLSALIWRLVNLNRLKRQKAEEILSSDAVKEYDKKIRKDLPGQLPHISERYLHMVFEAVNQGIMSKMRAVEYLDVPLIKLEDTFSLAGLSLEELSKFEINL